jgi:hypothetical protein
VSKISYILREELHRLQRLAAHYQKEIDTLPRGSISLKKRNNRVYVYLAYRNGSRMKFDYIGSEMSSKAVECCALVKKRQQIKKQLNELKTDIREIEKVLNE